MEDDTIEILNMLLYCSCIALFVYIWFMMPYAWIEIQGVRIYIISRQSFMLIMLAPLFLAILSSILFIVIFKKRREN